jgi:biotin transporter BioY
MAMLPFAVCTLAANRWWHAPTLLFFFAQVAAVLPSALLGVWYLGLQAEERQAFAGLFSRFLNPSRQA